eukprot:45667_1
MDIEHTTFYKHIKLLVDSIKAYFAFSNRAIFELKEEQIDKLGSIVLDIKKNWNSFVSNCQTVKNMSLGNKFHGFYHGYEHQKCWSMTAGVDDEQSVEKFNKILSEIHQRYISKRHDHPNIKQNSEI